MKEASLRPADRGHAPASRIYLKKANSGLLENGNCVAPVEHSALNMVCYKGAAARTVRRYQEVQELRDVVSLHASVVRVRLLSHLLSGRFPFLANANIG